MNGIFISTTSSTSLGRPFPTLPDMYTTSIEVKTHWKGRFIVYIAKEHRDGQQYAMYFQTFHPAQNQTTASTTPTTTTTLKTTSTTTPPTTTTLKTTSTRHTTNTNHNSNPRNRYHPSRMAVFFDFDQNLSRGVDVTGGRKICRWVSNTSRFAKDVENISRHPGALTTQLFGDTRLNNYTFMGPSTIRNLRYFYYL